MAQDDKTKNLKKKIAMKKLCMKDVVVRNYYLKAEIKQLIENRKIINTIIKQKRKKKPKKRSGINVLLG